MRRALKRVRRQVAARSFAVVRPDFKVKRAQLKRLPGNVRYRLIKPDRFPNALQTHTAAILANVEMDAVIARVHLVLEFLAC